MTEKPSRYQSDAKELVDQVIASVGPEVTLGLPLGLGKPNRFVNAFYQRACEDKSIRLHIVTALSLLAPGGSSSLEKRFMGPFAERLYGRIPELAYARDVASHTLPENVSVSEFFFKAGSYLHHTGQQRNYICTNYTHAVRDLLSLGVNVVAQMVAPAPGGRESEQGKVSLSCNPDLTLDLMPMLREQGRDRAEPVVVVGETNHHLPYLANHAAVPEDTFDFLLHQPDTDYPLFSAPQMNVSPEDHLIGFYASSLLRDGGTLQVGIGSLGAALVHSTILRHRNNAVWRRVYDHLTIAQRFPVAAREGGTGPFEQGLYGCSEMMVDGFLHLLDAGVLKREVFDHAPLQELVNRGRIGPGVSLQTLDVLREEGLISSPLRARDLRWLSRFGILREDVDLRGGRLLLGDYSVEPDLDNEETRQALQSRGLGEKLSGGVVAHGGFYLGPESFYQRLRELTDDEQRKICMTSVNFINHLYDHAYGGQRLKVAQRVHSRFVNSAMMHTLSGAAVSDGLEDGRVVSGVGGQYNFVAMAHELPGARSILCLRATRQSGDGMVSNIVFSYGHCTIPRHLRDIVITEYGIADLRGQPDEQVYLRLIRIADSRFQEELLKQAQKAGKVDPSFSLPDEWQGNTPESVRGAISLPGMGQVFPPFPFGCDFTDEELVLGRALKALKAATSTSRGKLATLWRALRTSEEAATYRSYLERMGLNSARGLRERMDRKLVIHGLRGINAPDSDGKA
ncbi:MAG: acetyl-CoA hydrolase/transferase C-terminal domain-containing protein [Pseudomonadota bacterium]|nr:acetyl-CoA hydrolase/transferase C-terminal domain-containing protein [Pseudomonadota bacterium]